MRLIDADKLLKVVEDNWVEGGWWFEKRIEEAPTIASTEWISAKDRLPDEFQRVLGVVEYDFDGKHYRVIKIIYHCSGGWEPLGRETDIVTHWLPLPSLPS